MSQSISQHSRKAHQRRLKGGQVVPVSGSTVRVERGGEERWWEFWSTDDPGCVSHGYGTPSEARRYSKKIDGNRGRYQAADNPNCKGVVVLKEALKAK